MFSGGSFKVTGNISLGRLEVCYNQRNFVYHTTSTDADAGASAAASTKEPLFHSSARLLNERPRHRPQFLSIYPRAVDTCENFGQASMRRAVVSTVIGMTSFRSSPKPSTHPAIININVNF